MQTVFLDERDRGMYLHLLATQKRSPKGKAAVGERQTGLT